MFLEKLVLVLRTMLFVFYYYNNKKFDKNVWRAENFYVKSVSNLDV